MMKSYKDINAYLNNQSKENKILLEKLRKTIKEAAPKSVEGISYGMPVFRQNGVLVYMGGFADHCSFFVGNGTTVAKFKEELKDFKTARSTIQFTAKKPLPLSLVKKIVKFRIKENESKHS